MLEAVVLHRGKHRLVATIIDRTKRRVIECNWHRKELDDLPPEEWYSTVQGEAEFQRSASLSPRVEDLLGAKR